MEKKVIANPKFAPTDYSYDGKLGKCHWDEQSKKYVFDDETTADKKTAANPNEELIKRLDAEHEDLFDKITRLADTLSNSAMIAKIGAVQALLLGSQLEAMRAYDNILLARIKLLK